MQRQQAKWRRREVEVAKASVKVCDEPRAGFLVSQDHVLVASLGSRCPLVFFIYLFLCVLGEKQSLEECFVVSLFSLKLTLHIKHILSPDGLTEWYNHIEVVKPLPLVDPTKKLCCGGAEQ